MSPPKPGRHAARSSVPFPVAMAVVAIVGIGLVVWRTRPPGDSVAGSSPLPSIHTSSTPPPSTPGTSPTPTPIPTTGPIDPRHPGLLTFRGNWSRSYYGEGPVPKKPVIRWRYPTTGSLCASSHDIFGRRVWCGTGWTGQPNVVPMPDGTNEVRIGAYDDHYHFLDGSTGVPTRPDLVTGDLAKGSATSDPNGYPLYYAGSRDNVFRIVAMDRKTPTVLWSMNANNVSHPLWNNDWDGAALIVGDYLLEGGENCWFYVVKLNRGYDAAGKVTVDPKIVMEVPGFDQQLLDTIGDKDVSIEDSVAYRNGVVYFANGGGLVEGWNISDILHGGTHYSRVFRFWNGDDTDASIVIDSEGFLYVGRKMEDNVKRPESFPRDHAIGDLMKLDPSKPTDPVVWSTQLGGFEPDGGVLGTPALYNGVVYATYTEGGVAAVSQKTGTVLWNMTLPGPTWSSPVVVDGKLIVGDGAGYLSCFDVSKPRKEPKRPLWHLQLGGIIESTPAVWHGWIYVGSRSGQIFGIADRHRK